MRKRKNIKMKSRKYKKRSGPVRIHPKKLEKEIVALIAEIAEVSKKKIGLDTDFVKDLGMDSMLAIEMLAAIETKYKIEIPEENLPKMTNMREVLRLTSQILG